MRILALFVLALYVLLGGGTLREIGIPAAGIGGASAAGGFIQTDGSVGAGGSGGTGTRSSRRSGIGDGESDRTPGPRGDLQDGSVEDLNSKADADMTTNSSNIE